MVRLIPIGRCKGGCDMKKDQLRDDLYVRVHYIVLMHVHKMAGRHCRGPAASSCHRDCIRSAFIRHSHYQYGNRASPEYFIGNTPESPSGNTVPPMCRHGYQISF